VVLVRSLVLERVDEEVLDYTATEARRWRMSSGLVRVKCGTETLVPEQ
jgi:hypothetical protein